MIVCTDGSPEAAAVLPAAASFARDLNLTCVVIQVVGPDEDVSLHGESPLQRIREPDGSPAVYRCDPAEPDSIKRLDG